MTTLVKEFNDVVNKNKEQYCSDKEKQSYVRGFNDAIQVIAAGYDIYMRNSKSSHK